MCIEDICLGKENKVQSGMDVSGLLDGLLARHFMTSGKANGQVCLFGLRTGACATCITLVAGVGCCIHSLSATWRGVEPSRFVFFKLPPASRRAFAALIVFGGFVSHWTHAPCLDSLHSVGTARTERCNAVSPLSLTWCWLAPTAQEGSSATANIDEEGSI